MLSPFAGWQLNNNQKKKRLRIRYKAFTPYVRIIIYTFYINSSNRVIARNVYSLTSEVT